jgi:hypothetical protein
VTVHRGRGRCGRSRVRRHRRPGGLDHHRHRRRRARGVAITAKAAPAPLSRCGWSVFSSLPQPLLAIPVPFVQASRPRCRTGLPLPAR